MEATLNTRLNWHTRFLTLAIMLIVALAALGVYFFPPRPTTPEEWVEVLYGEDTYFYADAAVAISADLSGEEATRGDPKERACIVGEAMVRVEAQRIVYTVTDSMLAYPPPDFPFNKDVDTAGAEVWEALQDKLPVPIFIPIVTPQDEEGVLVVLPIPCDVLAQVIAEVWNGAGEAPPEEALRLAINQLDPKGKAHVRGKADGE